MEVKAERNIDDFFLIELNNLQVFQVLLDDPTPILADNYLDNSQKLLSTLQYCVTPYNERYKRI